MWQKRQTIMIDTSTHLSVSVNICLIYKSSSPPLVHTNRVCSVRALKRISENVICTFTTKFRSFEIEEFAERCLYIYIWLYFPLNIVKQFSVSTYLTWRFDDRSYVIIFGLNHPLWYPLNSIIRLSVHKYILIVDLRVKVKKTRSREKLLILTQIFYILF